MVQGESAIGKRTRGGRHWRQTSLRKMLLTRTMLGVNSLGVRFAAPVLDESTFSRLTSLLSESSRKPANERGVKSSKYARAGGLTRCSCGRRMFGQMHRGRSVLYCSKAADPEACGSNRIDHDALERYVFETIERTLAKYPRWLQRRGEPDDVRVQTTSTLDHGVSGGRASRPEFDRALAALHPGDTLVVTMLDRLGRSALPMLALADRLKRDGVALRVLNLGGESIDTSTPTGSLLFTIMAGLAEMELAIKRERGADSVAKRRAVGRDLGGRRRIVTDAQVRAAWQRVQAGESASSVARSLGVSRATLYRRQTAVRGIISTERLPSK